MANNITGVGNTGVVGPTATTGDVQRHEDVLSLIDSIESPFDGAGAAATSAPAPTVTGGYDNTSTFSPTNGDRELNRLDRQDGRINRNHNRDRLTDKEYRQVERQQMRVGNAVINALADGHIDANEQAKIDKLQDKANLNIYRQSHDKQGKGGRFEQRSKRQDERIENAGNRGGLTRGEERRLEVRANNVDRAINRARADGTVTEGEARRLDRMQDNLSRAIYNQAHDGQRTNKK